MVLPTEPSPCRIFNTLSGNAELSNATNLSAINGVSSDGLNTTVFPATRAGVIRFTAIAKG